MQTSQFNRLAVNHSLANPSLNFDIAIGCARLTLFQPHHTCWQVKRLDRDATRFRFGNNQHSRYLGMLVAKHLDLFQAHHEKSGCQRIAQSG